MNKVLIQELSQSDWEKLIYRTLLYHSINEGYSDVVMCSEHRHQWECLEQCVMSWNDVSSAQRQWCDETFVTTAFFFFIYFWVSKSCSRTHAFDFYSQQQILLENYLCKKEQVQFKVRFLSFPMLWEFACSQFWRNIDPSVM